MSLWVTVATISHLWKLLNIFRLYGIFNAEVQLCKCSASLRKYIDAQAIMKFVAPSESDIAFRRPFWNATYRVRVCTYKYPLEGFFMKLYEVFLSFSWTDVEVRSICIRVTSFKRRGKLAPTQKNKGRKWWEFLQKKFWKCRKMQGCQDDDDDLSFWKDMTASGTLIMK